MRRRRRLLRLLLPVLLGLALPCGARSKDPPLPFSTSLLLPRASGSVRFAVFGDSGTGGAPQYALAETLLAYYDVFPFEFVLMLGDNLYGGNGAADYEKEFVKPYQILLDSGVKFHAALGNHDNPNERFFKAFNMGSQRYYSFKPAGQSVRFFALDSTYMDPEQIAWLEHELQTAREDWKICYFHHPIYSSGKRHGPARALREVLEPLFLRYGVNLVLTGHEHFYERLKPQNGITYITSGAGGKLGGGVNPTGLTEKFYEGSQHFILFELIGDELHFQAIATGKKLIDSGVIRRRPAAGAVQELPARPDGT